MRKSTQHRYSGRSGFSLVEMLVAMAVLALLVLLIAQIISMSSRTLQVNSRKLDGVAEARFVLDRVGIDMASRIKRADVPDRFIKNAGNDSLGFYSEIEGFGGSRKVSIVDYRIQEALPSKKFQLERAAVGTDWSGAPTPLSFRPSLLVAPADSEYDVLSEGVLRLEFCYLRKDGSVSNNAPANPKDLAGFVVAVAVLDHKSRKIVETDQMKALAEALPDPPEGRDPLAYWQEIRKSGGFAAGVPPQAVEAIRFSQRHYYVR